jgi:hypothetical protein
MAASDVEVAVAVSGMRGWRGWKWPSTPAGPTGQAYRNGMACLVCSWAVAAGPRSIRRFPLFSISSFLFLFYYAISKFELLRKTWICFAGFWV